MGQESVVKVKGHWSEVTGQRSMISGQMSQVRGHLTRGHRSGIKATDQGSQSFSLIELKFHKSHMNNNDAT